MSTSTTGTADPSTADESRGAARPPGSGLARSTQVARSGPDVLRVWLPGLGSVQLSRPELAYVGGIVGLTALGLIEWPIALVIAAGHVLAADRSSQTVQDLGRAVGEA
jgi:hypothetical protein